MDYPLIAKSRYTSEEYLKAEYAHLWPHVWQVAGASRDIPEVGNYLTYEIGDESVLVVRQARGVRAFHNVCQHRGRRLREPGIGKAAFFRCVYHGWEWNIDGCLKHVPDLDTFPQGIQPETHALQPVACEEFAGQIWVCFDTKGPPLREYLGDLGPLLDAYDLQEYILMEDQAVDVPCNWKLAVDAFNEAYHVRFLHPAIAPMIDSIPPRIDLIGRHMRMTVPFFKNGTEDQPRHGPHWMLREAGLDSSVQGSSDEVRRKVQLGIRARHPDLIKLSDDQLTEKHQFHVFPNVHFYVYWQKYELLRYRPHPTNSGRMVMEQQIFERMAPGLVPPARPPRQEFVLGNGSLGEVADQDLANLVRVQAGMRSSGIQGLTLGTQEIGIRHMHDNLSAYVPY